MSDTPAGPLPAGRGPRAKGAARASAGGSGTARAAAGGSGTARAAAGGGTAAETEAASAARTRGPGRPARRAEAAGRTPARHRIGIRELRQQASVYVDLAEKGYTVDITNRGRLVAQLIPVREPGSPLERLITAGIVEPAEEPGGVGDLEPYPPSGQSGPQ